MYTEHQAAPRVEYGAAGLGAHGLNRRQTLFGWWRRRFGAHGYRVCCTARDLSTQLGRLSSVDSNNDSNRRTQRPLATTASRRASMRGKGTITLAVVPLNLRVVGSSPTRRTVFICGLRSALPAGEASPPPEPPPELRLPAEASKGLRLLRDSARTSSNSAHRPRDTCSLNLNSPQWAIPRGGGLCE
jgi:hypothetical protein